MKYPELRKYQDESWYSHILHLWEFGFCTPERRYIYNIMNACHDLNYHVIHRRFSNKDYILKSNEYGQLWSYNRSHCLCHLKENVIKELSQVSESPDYETPKAGMITEWLTAQEDYYMLLQMMDEIPHNESNIDNLNNPVSVYVGILSGWSGRSNIIEEVDFGVLRSRGHFSSLDEKRILKIDRHVAEQWILNGYYDEERHRRYDKEKCTLLRAYVNSINYIIRLEWIEYEDKPFIEKKESYYHSIEREKRIRQRIRNRNSRPRKPVKRRFTHLGRSNNRRQYNEKNAIFFRSKQKRVSSNYTADNQQYPGFQ